MQHLMIPGELPGRQPPGQKRMPSIDPELVIASLVVGGTNRVKVVQRVTLTNSSPMEMVMGKHFNAEVYRQIALQEPDDDEPEYSPEEDWEAGFSDWKHQKDDDLASAVRRYAVATPHVRLFDEGRA